MYPVAARATTVVTTIDTTVLASDVSLLPVGVRVFWTLTFDSGAPDEDPSPDVFLATGFPADSARAERPPYPAEPTSTLASNGFLTQISATGSTGTWQATGNLDLIGLLPFDITLTGIGISVDSPLPEFEAFAGGTVELDVSSQQALIGGTFTTMQVDAIHVPEASSGLLLALACAAAAWPASRYGSA